MEEHSNRQRTPYLFTGKELDEDVQLYYFGARYYDPRTSVWQSPDPILAEYLRGRPAGGVFAPPNLNLYGYVHQRPIIAADPNGEFLNFIAGAALGAVIDVAAQGAMMAIGAQDSFSWTSVAVAAGSGATGVGLSSVVAKNAARIGASKVVSTAATLGGETAIGVGEQVLMGEEINVKDAALGAVIGEASGAAAGALLRRGNVGDAAETATEQVNRSVEAPTQGQKVYRVYGGDSGPNGASWSPVDPSTVPDYRDAAGLPSGGESGATNSGRFVIEGTLQDPSATVLTREALPLDGTTGGLPEYIIPNAIESGAVRVDSVGGVNPEY
ncbi:RHS repeat-associated core domain-containing protein [Aliiroseovarius crassostreae]|uniref:RHS repeat-associated core domain-containing protein n=1 Tax=Aliiroseovarius crassostreae TaxID=154981 RepID=UPI0021FCA2D4|nr:RHS repeat-associated core domain-containing protein [Aliiroseovarius crassostreae]UWQ06666.1 RHS repeat-associated core domain-containing protein [Aliiroseovarius crassostreae]